MAIAFLSTLAVQIGSACFNNFRSKKHAQEMARKQQVYEEKVVREGIDNARAEFADLCTFQRELEAEMQQDRLNVIYSNHRNSLLQAAYDKSLESWPLMVPPYVIKNDTLISANQSSDKAIPLNCILTTSTDAKFNKSVFYKIEEELACFCSKYWNVSASKSIRFFQEAWRDNYQDVGVMHKDLYAHLSDVPTLVISPIIKDGRLLYRFYWWGLSIDPAYAHLNDISNEFDPDINSPIEFGHNYSEEEIATIISICIPKLKAFISFFADMYYWNFYKVVPSLPNLLSSHSIKLEQSEVHKYISAYKDQVIKYLDDSRFQIRDANLLLETTESLLQNSTDKSVLLDIQQSILNNSIYLSSCDLPILNGLSKLNPNFARNLNDVISNLEEQEAISIHPFSNSEEMFYQASLMIAFPKSRNKELHIKFINDYAFIACVVDDSKTVLYTNPKSRFHIFITNTRIPLSSHGAGVLEVQSHRFNPIKSSVSPCDQLQYNIDAIHNRIELVKSFLCNIQKIYKQLYPVIGKHINEIGVKETTSLIQVKEWLSSNYSIGNQFRIALSYDINQKLYCLIGSFAESERIIDNKTYISLFKFLDESIKTLLNYEYGCIINLKK